MSVTNHAVYHVLGGLSPLVHSVCLCEFVKKYMPHLALRSGSSSFNGESLAGQGRNGGPFIVCIFVCASYFIWKFPTLNALSASYLWLCCGRVARLLRTNLKTCM